MRGIQFLMLPALAVVYLLWAIWLIHKSKPDALHVNSGGYPGSIFGRILPIVAKLFGVEVVTFTVNNLASKANNRAVRLLDTSIGFLLQQSVHRFITASIASKGFLARELMQQSSRIEVLPNGIDYPEEPFKT
jgi:hypothetical protein